MAGEAILAYIPDQMFSVQLREAAIKRQSTVSLVGNTTGFITRLQQMLPALVILDLAVVGGDIDHLVRMSKASGSRVIAYGPHVQMELLERARVAGCDAVYPISRFKMDTEDILAQWLKE